MVEVPGGSFAEVLLLFDGTETVVEVNTGNGLAYFCGTEALVSLMEYKGASLLCRDASVFFALGKQQKLFDVADVFFPLCTEVSPGQGVTMSVIPQVSQKHNPIPSEKNEQEFLWSS